ncbi:MAG: phosphoribosylaminoimidazolesuccinocarboxamide synthase [Chitinivibrionales bacterium]|nr:phosphoribosylaminoimidazolesuccinocarboxamide synthase [Chitinivibrionales bacterium]MBD3358001.1 phosphoribosylaminoimidazolesuccinocarboxamide synthase [Chitinivibrionales bacterium]
MPVTTIETIRANLHNCLDDTSSLNLPNGKKGKVRDTYDLGDSLVLITTDRQSAFDRILASVPFKGQVLNQVSEFWFEQTKDIVRNHVLEVPDPNVTIGMKCQVLPIEFVVRGYLTGSTSTSAWTQYNRGLRDICGNKLPDGMVKNQKLEHPILTPTTKSEEHDESISAEEIVAQGLIEESLWKKLEEIVFALFARGQRIAARNGLILVDTKYELGIDRERNVVLVDEIHTPDSSRYWIAESYEKRFTEGLEPESIDKEFLRLWFKEHCDPYNDPELPPAPDDLVVEVSLRYIQLYERITGRQFEVDTTTPIQERLEKNLAKLK